MAALTHDRRELKILTLIDEYTWECLAFRVERRLGSDEVIETLAAVMTTRGLPAHLRSDNASEFIAKQLRRWLSGVGAAPLYIEPASLGKTVTAKVSTASCATSASTARFLFAAGSSNRHRTMAD